MRTTSASGGSRDPRSLPLHGRTALRALCLDRLRYHAAERTACHDALRGLLLRALRRVRHRGKLADVLHPPLRTGNPAKNAPQVPLPERLERISHKFRTNVVRNSGGERGFRQEKAAPRRTQKGIGVGKLL